MGVEVVSSEEEVLSCLPNFYTRLADMKFNNASNVDTTISADMFCNYLPSSMGFPICIIHYLYPSCGVTV